MDNRQVSYYIAVLLYESSSQSTQEPKYEPLYEETFVLIQASSIEEAREKANKYAQREQGSYFNEQHEEITWSLKHIIDVNAVLYEPLEDGTELYARHFRNYEAYRLFEPFLLGEI
jgi:hypothetical protein